MYPLKNNIALENSLEQIRLTFGVKSMRIHSPQKYIDRTNYPFREVLIAPGDYEVAQDNERHNVFIETPNGPVLLLATVLTARHLNAVGKADLITLDGKTHPARNMEY